MRFTGIVYLVATTAISIAVITYTIFSEKKDDIVEEIAFFLSLMYLGFVIAQFIIQGLE